MEQVAQGIPPELFVANLTPERRAIFEKLQERQWFKETAPELQKQLLTLPSKGIENHDGFLKDLAERPEQIASIKVERMVDLPRGSFALVPKFEVSRLDNPSMRYTYEYVSSRTGPYTGAKGVVFVEDNGNITHVIALQGEKFATGKPSWDSIGGFVDTSIQAEIKEELGVPELTIQRIDDLGKINPDVGMSNNEPSLFAAVISASDAKKISSKPVNPDIRELASGTVVIPIQELSQIVMNNNDAFFLSTIARAWAKGIIAPPQGILNTSVGFSLN